MGEETPIDKNEIFSKLEEVQKYVAHHTANLPNTIWETMNGLSATLIAFKDNGGQEGWANVLKNSQGTPIWSQDQQAMLGQLLPNILKLLEEKQEQTAETVETVETVQEGGGKKGKKGKPVAVAKPIEPKPVAVAKPVEPVAVPGKTVAETVAVPGEAVAVPEVAVPEVAKEAGEAVAGKAEAGKEAQVAAEVAKAALPLEETGSGVKALIPTDLSWISLDGIHHKAKTFLKGIDDKNKELARSVGTLAIVKSYEDKKDDVLLIPKTPPYIPFDIKVPPRLIPVLINTLLESIRLLVTVTFDNKLLRQLFSLVIALFDISRGEWKDGILSFLGVFSKNLLFVGLVGKTTRWVYNFISPNLRNDLEEDIFKAGKSMIAGFWLWIGSIVSPVLVRNAINNLIEKANTTAENINKQIATVEQASQTEAAAVGMKIEYPRVPLDDIPSFDDIQNFQMILQQPAVFCNPAVQGILQGPLKIPPLRIFLELLNMPTQPEDIAKYCKDQPTIVNALAPIITPVATPEAPVSPEAPTSPEAPVSPEVPVASPALPEPKKGGKRTAKKREKKGKKKTRKATSPPPQ